MKIKMRYGIGIILIIGALLAAGCSSKPGVSSTGDAIKVTMYKSPTCGCCAGHAAELERQGFDVEIIPTSDMQSIKQKYGIPSNMRSCHTSIIGDYVVEGHIPIEAIEKLISEKPDIDGIAMPGMPAGSPGMPGIKRGDFVVYALSDGQTEEFARI